MTESEISEFTKIAQIKTFEKKSYFIRDGQISTEFGFVLSGLFRYIYISEKGKEFTKAFMPEKSFISSYLVMVSKTTSYFFIEAIEQSKVLIISNKEW